MNNTKLTAAAVGLAIFAITAFVLELTAPTLPHWRMAPDSEAEHVMSLAWHTQQNQLYAGTQTGALLIGTGGDWHSLPGPAERPITAILTAPDLLLGTGAGLYRRADDGQWLELTTGLPTRMRIGDLQTAADQPILLAGAEGIFQSDDQGRSWQALDSHGLPATAVYRIASAGIDGGRVLHAGLIGAGVYSRIDNGRQQTAWLANNAGLPAEAKVLSLLPLTQGALLAGTDRGVYRQAQPFTEWQPLGRALGRLRVLSLALDRQTGSLWAGSDHGVYRADAGLLDDGGTEDWRQLPPGRAFAAPVSTVLPTPQGMYLAAGDIYYLEQRRIPDPLRLLSALLLGAIGFAVTRYRLANRRRSDNTAA